MNSRKNLGIRLAVCMLLPALTIVVPAIGDTHYVSPGQSIQAAIDDANDGDDIEVAPGIYNEAINFNGKAVRLYSSGGREVTTIDANGAHHVVQCVSGEEPNTILDGFTIRGGANGTRGGGMYCENSSPTVINCVFSDNIATYGGGMYNDQSSPTVINCTFTGNKANYYGGGMCNNGSSPTITDCNFSGNQALSATYGGGGMSNHNNSIPTVINCTFSGNSGSYGGGMYNNASNPAVTNCTFSSNSATDWGGGMYNYDSSPTVANCTLLNNIGNAGGGMYNNESSPTVANCTFLDNIGSAGGGMFNHTSSNPTLTNCTFIGNTATTNGGGMYNYTISNPTLTNCTFSDNTANSGGGMCNVVSSPEVSNCILWGDTPDEIYNISSSPTVTYSDVQGWTSGGAGNISADPCFVDAAGGDFRLASDSLCVDTGNTGAVPPDTTDLDGDGDTTEPIPFDLNQDPRVWNDVVDMGAFEYGELRVHNVTQNTSYIGIQKAIDDANNGDEIKVDPGTYKEETIDFKSKAIRLYSAAGPNDTIIDGTGNYHVVQFVSGEDTSTIMEGFTITGGNANGTSSHGYGGGMYCQRSSPTITCCTFSGNTAKSGGGMCNLSSSPLVNNCTFSVNTADGSGIYDGGGGMYNFSSSPEVNNCTFSGNTETEYGGGMYNFSSNPKVNNCTFSGNTETEYGGGMYNFSSSPCVTGCTFSGNTATEYGGGMYNQVSSPEVTNCNFGENSAGDGGGMYNINNSSPTLTNCTISGNTASRSGGGMHNQPSSHPTIINCTFSGNTAMDGGGMYNYFSSNPAVVNSTFTGNTATTNGGGMCNSGSIPTVTNCTFTGNTATTDGGGMYNNFYSSPTVTNCILWGDTPDGIYDEASSSATVTYSDVQGWTRGGAGNISADPCFVDANGGDLRLSYDSPCVDAGNNNATYLPTTDLAGKFRVLDGDGDGTVVVDMGAYELQTGVHNITQGLWYGVIQEAIDGANTGDEIEVSPGTYNEAINFKGKTIRLYSSGGPAVTTIDGTGNYHVVQCVSGEDANTILEGFTITGGNADGPDPNDRTGGGMYNEHSSPTVTNCVFFNNYAADAGGAMLNSYSDPNITNCTFYSNTAGREAGGMRNYESSPTVTNCILWADGPDEINDVNSLSVVTYSDVRGGWAGEGNIDKYPLFRNVPEGDLSLAPWSPCIDKGSNAAVSPYATDTGGPPRLVDGDCNGTITVDIGAYEFQHAYGGDFDSSCLVNMADFAVLAWAWLANPLSENWDPLCDIGIPADGSIDNRDLRVLTGNWLRDVDTPITCDANRLKDEFGLDAASAAAVLRAAPCSYSNEDLVQVLYDAGYSAAGAHQALTQVCGMTDIFSVEQILYDSGYPPEEYLESTALESVRKFAPILYFDRAHKGLPMSAQIYFETVMSPFVISTFITWTTPWDGPCGRRGVTCLWGRDECTCGMQNNNFSTLENGQIPTYYKVISDIDSNEPTGDKGRLRIWYWWFYGFQGPCNTDCPGFGIYCGADGAHHGDWEHIIVTTDPNRIRADAVTYSFHGDWYTRQWGGFEDIGGRPVVYVGRLSHGNWHSDEISCLWEGEAHHCCEYADCRTPDENTKWLTAYKNLVSLSGNSEPWMSADRIGSNYEYQGKEYTILDWKWGPHISYCDIQDYEGGCYDWVHKDACGTHPTTGPFNWIVESCDGVGCGASSCGEFPLIEYYPITIDYDQSWPWGGGAASSASESATPARPAKPSTYGSVASCGRCGVSRFAAMLRLGEYWLATP